MKKTLSRIAALLIAASMCFAMAACANQPAQGDGDGADANPDSGVKKIGIAMPTKSLERWNRDGSFLQKEFEADGFEVDLKYSDNKADKQVSDIENMIADGADILVVAAIDGESLTQVLDTAAEANIPVIAYDRLIMNTKAISYYVSFDNYTVGTLQGKFVEEELGLANAEEGKSFNIEFTAGDPADNNAGYFFNGAYDVLKPYIDSGVLNVVSGQTDFNQVATPQWLTENALNRMQDILSTNYSDGTLLDVALCSNDSTALGVAQAIENDYNGDNKADIIVTGQDGDEANLRNIIDGKQTMTVYKAVANEAVVTVALAKAILNGETPDASLTSKFDCECAYDTSSYNNGTGIIPSYLLVPTVVTKENIDKELVQTGYYKWDGDYPVANG